MKTKLNKILILILVIMTMIGIVLPTNSLAEETADKFEDMITGIIEDGENVIFQVKSSDSYSFWDADSAVGEIIIKRQDGGIISSKIISRTNGDRIGITYELESGVNYIVEKNVFYSLTDKYSTTARVITQEGNSLFEKLEEMLASVVRGTANALIKLINLAVVTQNGVTVDDVIFNHYEPTRLLYFDKDSAESPLIGEIAGAINKWSSVFTEIAIVVYMAALLYMGIQILLRSTAPKKAEYQRLLVDWVVGIGLLFFFPLLVKYSIQINDALVAQIETSKSDAAVAAQSSNSVSNSGMTSIGANATDAQKAAFANSWDSSPYSEDNNNYMAVMNRKARDSKKLSYSIVYMIMAWQLLMILVAYYKRLFMVGFLLVLFPLVALTYAIDKVKDGKSQAFDRWAKEIILNIFLQTFHAIIYVFAVNASLVGGEQSDWILMIMGISFLFKGEEIIKGLFGQKAESVSSLKNTAMKTVAIYTAVTAGAKKLGDNFVGRNSHLGKAITARRNARTYDMMAGNFDTLASTGPEFTMPAANRLAHAPSVMDAESTQVGDDIQTVNNRDMASAAELAQAINRLQNYHGKYTGMLQDLNVDIGKLNEMQTIKEGAIRQLKSGTDKVTVEQNIKLELETLFGKEDAGKMQQVLYHQMALPLNSNHLSRNTAEAFVKSELNDARQRRKEINDSYNFSSTDGTFGSKEQTEASDLLYNTYGKANITDEQKNMAKAITIVKNRESKEYSIKQQVAAMNYIIEHKDDDEHFKEMIDTLGEDIDEMSLALAHNVKIRAVKGGGVAAEAQKWAERTIEYYKNDNTPLSDDLQEISILQLYEEEPLSVVGQDSSEKIVNRVINKRIDENRREAELLRDFAADRITREKVPEPTINGMTKSELYAMAEDERTKAAKETFRSVAETSGAVLAIPTGTAAGIAFAETDKGAIAEGLAGGFAGAVVGDQAVSKVLGGTKEKQVTLKNPYTGEDEKVIIKVGGAFSERLLAYGDTSELPESVRGSIRQQFIATAAAKRRKEADEKQKEIDKANKRNKS